MRARRSSQKCRPGAPLSAALVLESTDGLELEALLDAPDDPKAGLVLCHPHPQMGGTMNAPLLRRLRDELVRRGWIVLRFNFRGIGGSEGEPSMGIAETQDAAGAVRALRKRTAGLPVAIAGWSFGASVAVRTAAADSSLAGCVAIAPAVEARPEVSAGLPAAAGTEIDVPLLLVCAQRDELVAAADCRGWAEHAWAEHIEIAGANHFFWGQYDRLSETVVGWLDNLVPG